MDDHVAKLIVEDFHRALNVDTGMVAKMIAEIHPAGLRKPWILVIVPGAMALHRKCQTQNIVLVLLFLTFKLHHGVHQLRMSLRSQSKGSTMDLRAERANHRMGGAPDHVAFRAGHKVGGNVRAGNLHCGDVFLSALFIFNFFHIQMYEKRAITLCFIVMLLYFWALFLKAHLGDGAEVWCIEREALWAAMDAVLGSSVTLAVFFAGRISVFLGLVRISVRCAMSLCELKTAVAALEEMAFRRDIHLACFHQCKHLTLLFLGILFRFRAGIVGAAFAAAMRGLASFAHILLSHIVFALKCEEAKRAIQANLANHGGVIHGLWQLLVWRSLLSIFYRKKGVSLFLFYFLLFYCFFGLDGI